MQKCKAIKLAMHLGIAFNWTPCSNYTNKILKQKLKNYYDTIKIQCVWIWQIESLMGNNLGFILKLLCSIFYYINQNTDLYSKKFLSSKKISAALHKTNFRRHNFCIISASGIIFSLNAKCCISFYSSVCAYFLLPFFTRMQDKFFPLKIWHLYCKVVLSSQMKCWTRPHQNWLLWNGPYRAKSRPALPLSCETLHSDEW